MEEGANAIRLLLLQGRQCAERSGKPMLVIRQAQLHSLSEARRTAFESRMIEHLRRIYPEWAEHHAAETLQAFVQRGVQRAMGHGFRVELDIARYLHVIA